MAGVEAEAKVEAWRHTQVAQFDVLARPVQQDVLELQVAVHHAALHAQHMREVERRGEHISHTLARHIYITHTCEL